MLLCLCRLLHADSLPFGIRTDINDEEQAIIQQNHIIAADSMHAMRTLVFDPVFRFSVFILFIRQHSSSSSFPSHASLVCYDFFVYMYIQNMSVFAAASTASIEHLNYIISFHVCMRMCVRECLYVCERQREIRMLSAVGGTC